MIELPPLKIDIFRAVSWPESTTLLIGRYEGRDYGPHERIPSPKGAGNVREEKNREQGIAAKAVPVGNEGPAGAVRQGRTGVRQKTAREVSTFWALGIRSIFNCVGSCFAPSSRTFFFSAPKIPT